MTTAVEHDDHAAVDPSRLAARGVLVVANPAAAGVDVDLAASVVAELSGVSADVRVGWTTGPGHGGELVREATAAFAPGLVVALGGDGTVREVAEAVAARADAADTALLTLPGGSGNSNARNIWGDLAVPEVLARVTAAQGCRVRRLDLLHLEEPGASSLLGASSGFLAQVLIDAADIDPELRGIDRYYAAAGKVLADMPSHPTRVTVDGRLLHDGPASSVAVGGGRFRAHAFQFLPMSVLDDGILDVSTIGPLDAREVSELAPLVPTGQHLDRPGVTYAQGRRVVIERTDGRPLVAEFDGDVWAAAGSRLTIEVRPAALPVLAPVAVSSG
jgi:diacylglycerol kinase (ATP)